MASEEELVKQMPWLRRRSSRLLHPPAPPPAPKGDRCSWRCRCSASVLLRPPSFRTRVFMPLPCSAISRAWSWAVSPPPPGSVARCCRIVGTRHPKTSRDVSRLKGRWRFEPKSMYAHDPTVMVVMGMVVIVVMMAMVMMAINVIRCRQSRSI